MNQPLITIKFADLNPSETEMLIIYHHFTQQQSHHCITFGFCCHHSYPKQVFSGIIVRFI